MVRPILADVRHQIRFAERVLNGREHDCGRVATFFRALEKHNVCRQIARAFGKIRFWKSLEGFHERASEFAAPWARVIDVDAVLRRSGLQPEEWFESGKRLTRPARTILTNHFADGHIRHAGDITRWQAEAFLWLSEAFSGEEGLIQTPRSLAHRQQRKRVRRFPCCK